MWPNLQKTADLVTFTEEILNGKLHFLGCVNLFLSHLELSSLINDGKKSLNKKSEAKI